MKVLFASARGLLALAVALSLSPVLGGGSAKAETEVAAMGGVVTAVVTVQAIDVTNRLLTVAMPQGNTMVIKLGPDVQHIEKIKVQDKVTIAYSEEVAPSLQKLAGPPLTPGRGSDSGSPAAAPATPRALPAWGAHAAAPRWCAGIGGTRRARPHTWDSA